MVILQRVSLIVAELALKTIDMMLLIDHVQRIAHLLHQILRLTRLLAPLPGRASPPRFPH